MAESSMIKTLRLRAKWSQNKLAREADLDRATVAAAESGKNVSDVTLSKLASTLSQALGVDVEADLIRNPQVRK